MVGAGTLSAERQALRLFGIGSGKRRFFEN